MPEPDISGMGFTGAVRGVRGVGRSFAGGFNRRAGGIEGIGGGGGGGGAAWQGGLSFDTRGVQQFTQQIQTATKAVEDFWKPWAEAEQKVGPKVDSFFKRLQKHLDDVIAKGTQAGTVVSGIGGGGGGGFGGTLGGVAAAGLLGGAPGAAGAAATAFSKKLGGNFSFAGSGLFVPPSEHDATAPEEAQTSGDVRESNLRKAEEGQRNWRERYGPAISTTANIVGQAAGVLGSAVGRIEDPAFQSDLAARQLAVTNPNGGINAANLSDAKKLIASWENTYGVEDATGAIPFLRQAGLGLTAEGTATDTDITEGASFISGLTGAGFTSGAEAIAALRSSSNAIQQRTGYRVSPDGNFAPVQESFNAILDTVFSQQGGRQNITAEMARGLGTTGAPGAGTLQQLTGGNAALIEAITTYAQQGVANQWDPEAIQAGVDETFTNARQDRADAEGDLALLKYDKAIPGLIESTKNLEEAARSAALTLEEIPQGVTDLLVNLGGLIANWKTYLQNLALGAVNPEKDTGAAAIVRFFQRFRDSVRGSSDASTGIPGLIPGIDVGTSIPGTANATSGTDQPGTGDAGWFPYINLGSFGESGNNRAGKASSADRGPSTAAGLVGLLEDTPHRVTSSRRPNSKNDLGEPSMHATGHAVDLAGARRGDVRELQAIYDKLKPYEDAGILTKLIYGGAGGGGWRSEDARRAHQDHIHAETTSKAMARSGMATASQRMLYGDVGMEPGGPQGEAPGDNPNPSSAGTSASAATYGGVKPWVAAAGNEVHARYPAISSIGGVGGRSGPSDHPSGHALDFMVGRGEDRDKPLGDTIAAYGFANWARLAVKYIIWDDKIANAPGSWKPYAHRDNPGVGQGDPTLRHLDHNHWSFQGTAGPGGPIVDVGGALAEAAAGGGGSTAASLSGGPSGIGYSQTAFLRGGGSGGRGGGGGGGGGGVAAAAGALGGAISGGAGVAVLESAARAVGVPQALLAQTIAIGLGESGGDPNIEGDLSLQDGTWGPSIGLWQVRSIKAESGKGTSRDATRLKDPLFNAQSMQEISGNFTNWNPWSVYKTGKFREYMAEAEAAAATPEAGDSGFFHAVAGMPARDPGMAAMGEGSFSAKLPHDGGTRISAQRFQSGGRRTTSIGNLHLTVKIEKASEAEADRFVRMVVQKLDDRISLEEIGAR